MRHQTEAGSTLSQVTVGGGCSGQAWERGAGVQAWAGREVAVRHAAGAGDWGGLGGASQGHCGEDPCVPLGPAGCPHPKHLWDSQKQLMGAQGPLDFTF